MTVVEFFSKNSVDNFINCFSSDSDRIYFIGDNRDYMNKYINIYKEILAEYGIVKDLLVHSTSKYDLDKILELYRDILETDSDFIFDLAGGDELFLVAIGIIYHQNQSLPDSERKNIYLRRFNIGSGTLKNFNYEPATEDRNISISVEENIRIYGGRITKKGSVNCFSDTEFKRDFEIMLDYVIKNRVSWNVQTGYIAQGQGNDYDNDSLTASYSLRSIKFNNRFNSDSHFEFLKLLEKHGVIRGLSRSKNNIKFDFKNIYNKNCLTISGLVLELYVYSTAKELKDKKGNSIFTDAATSVIIDWDGITPPKNRPNITNEIDVLLMKEARPIFISCKNGSVDTEELFKLRAVANEFGGKYTKAVLICPELSIDHDENAEKRVRASELNIEIIKDVKKSELSKRLSTL